MTGVPERPQRLVRFRVRLRRSAAAAALAFAFALPAPPASPAAGDEPALVIDRLHRVLLEVMKNAETLGYAGRYQKVLPAVTASYDTAFMARKSVGRHWDELSDDQKRKWLDLFLRLTASTYAGRFTGWSGQSFETLGTEDAAAETRIVRTVLRNPEDEDVELNYRMRRTENGWRIIDVYLDGTVSELALRRSEYSSVLKKDGFDSLVSSVDRKISDYESGKSSS
jgi:phospholipid transport system substrate-binding protein